MTFGKTSSKENSGQFALRGLTGVYLVSDYYRLAIFSLSLKISHREKM